MTYIYLFYRHIDISLYDGLLMVLSGITLHLYWYLEIFTYIFKHEFHFQKRNKNMNVNLCEGKH